MSNNTLDEECSKKIEKLNQKIIKTTNELEEISTFYANSVKDGIKKWKKTKNKKIKLKNIRIN